MSKLDKIIGSLPADQAKRVLTWLGNKYIPMPPLSSVKGGCVGADGNKVSGGVN